MIAFKKAKIVLCILIVLFISFACSCCSSSSYDNSNNNTDITDSSIQPSEKVIESNTTTIDETQNTISYYNYYTAMKSAEYQNAIRNNIIDIQYTSEISKCFTTKEQIELENKYMNIWKNELNHSISILTTMCNEQLNEKIISAQTKWEESLLLQMNMEKELLNKDIGSGSIVQLISKYKDIYRYRTFEIKYLSYSIESWENPLLDDYSSLRFLNQITEEYSSLS